jgi:hypothetical protein
MLELFRALLTQMPKDASADLRERVHQLGREGALETLIDDLARSPMGPAMPKPILRELCELMLANALLDGEAKPGGKRARRFF